MDASPPFRHGGDKTRGGGGGGRGAANRKSSARAHPVDRRPRMKYRRAAGNINSTPLRPAAVGGLSHARARVYTSVDFINRPRRKMSPRALVARVLGFANGAGEKIPAAAAAPVCPSRRAAPSAPAPRAALNEIESISQKSGRK